MTGTDFPVTVTGYYLTCSTGTDSCLTCSKGFPVFRHMILAFVTVTIVEAITSSQHYLS